MLQTAVFAPEPWPRWLEEAQRAYNAAHPNHHKRQFSAIRVGTPGAFSWYGAFASGDPMNRPHVSDPLPSEAGVYHWFRGYLQYLVDP